MQKRKAIPKKVRFEVFKRDKFTCQYCGAKPPADDVILHVDHINPVALGGTNSILNLITSCQSCNLGKKATPLDDNAALTKKRLQLDTEAEKAEQIEMLMRWEQHLSEVSTDEADLVVDYIHSLAGIQMPEFNVAKVRRIAKKYGNDAAKAAAETCLDFYLKGETEDDVSRALAFAISKLESFCKTNQMEQEHRGYSQIFYAAGILANKFRFTSKTEAIKLLMVGFNAGVPAYELLREAKSDLESIKDVACSIEYTSSIFNSKNLKEYDISKFFIFEDQINYQNLACALYELGSICNQEIIDQSISDDCPDIDETIQKIKELTRVNFCREASRAFGDYLDIIKPHDECDLGDICECYIQYIASARALNHLNKNFSEQQVINKIISEDKSALDDMLSSGKDRALSGFCMMRNRPKFIMMNGLEYAFKMLDTMKCD